MSLAFAEIGLGHEDPLRDAIALAALARDCATSGVERRVLLLRLSLLPPEQRLSRHLRLIREALAPVLRPTRARLFELPGGDLAALAPPPGEHLEIARAAVRALLPEAAEAVLSLLRLPAEAAALLGAVEESLGLAPVPAPEPPAAASCPAPDAAALEAALRGLARSDIAAHGRRRATWRLAAGEDAAALARQDLRVNLDTLWDLLLPGTAPSPAQRRLFRHVAERRFLAGLARPEETRELGPSVFGLSLASLSAPEFLRLETLMGPLGRRSLGVCVPLEDALEDPGGFARLRRWAAARGWALGLDDVPAAALPALPLARQALPVLRLRFSPALLRLDAAAREALDAALPTDRGTVVLTGTEWPAAIAWGWQRGITLFEGSLLRPR